MIRLGLTNHTPLKSSQDSPPSSELIALFPRVAHALAETAAWCSLKTSRSHGLRTPALDPSAMLEPRRWIEAEGSIHNWVKKKSESYRLATSHIAQRRSDLLQEMNVPISEEYKQGQTQGRLLIYLPMETVTDGASEGSSKKFFDIEDAPPWDTWVWHSNGTILSWVPRDLTSRAQAGIDANPVDCIHWAVPSKDCEAYS